MQATSSVFLLVLILHRKAIFVKILAEISSIVQVAARGPVILAKSALDMKYLYWGHVLSM